MIVVLNIEKAPKRLNEIIRRVFSWKEEYGLSLTAEKMEIVLLTERNHTEVQMTSDLRR